MNMGKMNMNMLDILKSLDSLTKITERIKFKNNFQGLKKE